MCSGDFVSHKWLYPGLLLIGSLLPAAVTAQEEADDSLSPLDQRIRIEHETRYQPFVLTPHKPNYLLPLTYNSKPNQAPFDPQQDGTIEEPEVKFQISIKMPVTDEIFDDSITLYAAYTNQSYWQAYNDDNSQPFREANHEPELFLAMQNDWEVFGFTNKLNVLGLSHQSNGQSDSKSRGWNRVYAQFIFERENFYLSLLDC